MGFHNYFSCAREKSSNTLRNIFNGRKYLARGRSPLLFRRRRRRNGGAQPLISGFDLLQTGLCQIGFR